MVFIGSSGLVNSFECANDFHFLFEFLSDFSGFLDVVFEVEMEFSNGAMADFFGWFTVTDSIDFSLAACDSEMLGE
jgi:hypothetical protein